MDDLTEDELRAKYGDPPFWDCIEGYTVNDYPLVEVTWLDAVVEEAHITTEMALQLCPMERKNAGYELYKDASKIIIYFGYLENFFKGGTATDVTLCIPMGMVKNIRYL